MDFENSLRRAIKSGNVLIGQKSTKNCILEGKAQMVVVARNCRPEFKTFLAGQTDLFTFAYDGSGMDLGKACGRPHMVSALAIVSAGESDILSLKRA